MSTAVPGAIAQHCADATGWICDYRDRVECTVQRIPFDQSRQWSFTPDQAALAHASGRFFAVRGYERQTSGRICHQPLIDQPEIGTQGFMVRPREDGLDVLVQARTEPGNIGLVQIGPSIQATFSNYTAVHGGKQPLFLDHFHSPQEHGARVLLDTTQPELGTRFLKKWNRNLVIEVPGLDFQHPMFHWLDLRALVRLAETPHLVNNDARLVLGLLMMELGESLFDDDDLASSATGVRQSLQSNESLARVRHWIERLRGSGNTKRVREISLRDVPGWQVEDDAITPLDAGEFSVIQVKVHASDREVTDWDQPLIASTQKDRLELVCSRHGGVLKLLLRAEDQIGNEHAQLQPTVSTDALGADQEWVAELQEQFEVLQCFEQEVSDEGGRFYQCVSTCGVRILEDDARVELPPHFAWLTLGELRSLLRTTDYVSDELRSVLGVLLVRCGRD